MSNFQQRGLLFLCFYSQISDNPDDGIAANAIAIAIAIATATAIGGSGKQSIICKLLAERSVASTQILFNPVWFRIVKLFIKRKGSHGSSETNRIINNCDVWPSKLNKNEKENL
ncbi:hypothetical protein LOAG_01512 [Loa loa]|uniref:Uncharacterized protein n=1 Tax=Loa loa TaxID=7209 RepID=A0A1S0U8L2_LOALO|nr:hypothetical protein LOAG_01512 [Loa loa]EFO26977.1 hypothetical protein LOAG_01512 [Loa loa]